jgi:hypothetical protein
VGCGVTPNIAATPATLSTDDLLASSFHTVKLVPIAFILVFVRFIADSGSHSADSAKTDPRLFPTLLKVSV